MIRSFNSIILVLISIFITKYDLYGQSMQINDVRTRFSKAIQSEELCKALYKEMMQVKGKQDPVFNGYLGAVTVSRSKYTFNPVNKLSYFQDGKKILEAAIDESPSNIELRFLRYAIQEHVPSFLGYTGNLSADKKLILDGLEQISLPKLKEAIINYIIRSNTFTDAEKQRVLTYR